ncbi:hypothetical protein HYH02_013633 [Chlamydomonas schloesseri]|uniref:phytol kinase n=1 Tax=Chlamydomonas schloesseri TaxID=2026947 RepID=A0A835T1C0_9CHLO|nr:hypothetical protein HYH02_013633 [Chlamydomonas schloesseri]|eukprot:KAG2430635.1 hypothetical protein HYH02_013633 [Chlamydomonas schloesseri]
MRRGRIGAAAAGFNRQQKSAVERDLASALHSLMTGQGLQRQLVDRLGSSRDELVQMPQSPENQAAVLAVLGWGSRETTRVALARQAQPAGSRAPGASEEELNRLMQLVSATLSSLTVEAETLKLGQAVARSQLPQALAALCDALFPPGLRCCGGRSGGAGSSSASSDASVTGSGSGGPAIGSAGLRTRLDVLVSVLVLAALLWKVDGQRVPELVEQLSGSGLVERTAAALLRAQEAECGQQPQQRSSSSSSSRNSSGNSTATCLGGWFRTSRYAKLLWMTYGSLTMHMATVCAPAIPPRTWAMPEVAQGVAGDIPLCRKALSGPALQLWVGRTLVAETHRCLAEAEVEVQVQAKQQHDPAGAGAGAGGSLASARPVGSPAAADASRQQLPPPPQQRQQQWYGLPEGLRHGILPMLRGHSNAADLLMDVCELAGVLWEFTVSGPQLPRLAQPPQKAHFTNHPASQAAVMNVLCGAATPEEAAAVAAAEAQLLPLLHPPSYTALQVFEMTHTALAAAVQHAPAEAVSVNAPSLLARLAMELPPRQAAARLPGLWRTLSRVLPRLASGGTGPQTDDIPNSLASFQGPFWRNIGLSRSETVRPLLYYMSMLLQLQLQLQVPASTSVAAAASGTASSAAAVAAAAAAAGGPAPAFSLRCALAGGLLPAIEALLRRLVFRTAAEATTGHSGAAAFLDAAHQASYVVNILLRISGVWPAILAHGPPRQVAALVRTMGKALRVVGDTFAALRQRPQMLATATQLLKPLRGSDKGQTFLFSGLATLLEQALVMTDQSLLVRGLEDLDCSTEAAEVAAEHSKLKLFVINDAIAVDAFAVDRAWVAAVGGCPAAGTAAATQQQALAAWSLQQWAPEMMRQASRDGRTNDVCSIYVVSLLRNVVQLGFWQKRPGAHLARLNRAGAAAPAVSPPAAAAAAAGGWRHFLLHDLDAVGWMEHMLGQAAADRSKEHLSEAPLKMQLGLFLHAAVSLEGAAGATGCASAGASGAAADADGGSGSTGSAAQGQLQEAGDSVGSSSSSSSSSDRSGTSRQQEQHARLLQHMRRLAARMGDNWVSAVELAGGLAQQLQAAGSTAVPTGGAASAATGVASLTSLLSAVESGKDRLLAYGGVPLPPCAGQTAAVLAEAGLALCGYPGCSSLEGDSEAELMATPGQHQKGGGGRIKTCSRCGVVRYCCGACQLQHWSTGGHKEACAGAAGGSRGGAGGGGKVAKAGK